ncbi:MAG: nucleoid-associated protein [Erysipelothrix sp.]
MNIEKVIIHSLDESLRVLMLSESQINLVKTPEVESYSEKFVKGLLKSTTSTHGKLTENSIYQTLINAPLNFVEVSQKIAQSWFSTYTSRMEYPSLNCLICQVEIEDVIWLALFEIESKSGYLKITENNPNLENKVIYNHAILPESFASVKAAWMLNLSTAEVCVRGNRDYKEIIQELVGCDLVANNKDSYKVVDSLVGYLSEVRDEETVKNSMKAKQIIQDNLELLEEISADALLNEVFGEFEEHEATMIETTLEYERVENPINLKELNRTSLAKKQRIKTESGIEIILPIDVLDVNDVLDIKTDTSGRVSIELKNIGKIIE